MEKIICYDFSLELNPIVKFLITTILVVIFSEPLILDKNAQLFSPSAVQALEYVSFLQSTLYAGGGVLMNFSREDKH